MEIITIAYDDEKVHRISSTDDNAEAVIELLLFLAESLKEASIEEVEGEEIQ